MVKEQLSINKLISIAGRQSSVYMNKTLKAYDINYTQFIFLMSLYKTNGLIQDEIVKENCIDKAAVTRAVKDLEVKGYITRQTGEKDRRVKKLFLTQKGLDIKPQLMENGRKWKELSMISIDEKAQSTLLHQLNTIIENRKEVLKNLKDSQGVENE
jgi:DNA-binding MarR family transcriptional regulator